MKVDYLTEENNIRFCSFLSQKVLFRKTLWFFCYVCDIGFSEKLRFYELDIITTKTIKINDNSSRNSNKKNKVSWESVNCKQTLPPKGKYSIPTDGMMFLLKIFLYRSLDNILKGRNKKNTGFFKFINLIAFL